MATIKLKNVSKTFGMVKVIKDLNLSIKSGEFLALVGPSGCGKSTLLRLIAGLENLSSGELLLNEKLANNTAPSKRHIAMVFQSYALYPHMNVFDNMAFGMKISKTSKDVINARIKETSKMLQIDHLLDRLPKQLSGGQRQRIAIGRAIVKDPKIFLFDEPLSNLDAALRVTTRLEIAKLHQRLKKVTMVYVTHDQVEAMTLADRICLLNEGNIAQIGTPRDLYDNPNNLFTAEFIGSPKMNILKGEIANKYNCTILGIRPEHIKVIQNDDFDISGTIIHKEDLGADKYIFVSLSKEINLIVRTNDQYNQKINNEVKLKFDKHRIHRFNKNNEAIKVNTKRG